MSFDAQLRTALQAIHAKPSAAEARAIIDVARLAAAADHKTDLSEAVVLLAVSRIVCEMAGVMVGNRAFDRMPGRPRADLRQEFGDIPDLA